MKFVPMCIGCLDHADYDDSGVVPHDDKPREIPYGGELWGILHNGKLSIGILKKPILLSLSVYVELKFMVVAMSAWLNINGS